MNAQRLSFGITLTLALMLSSAAIAIEPAGPEFLISGEESEDRRATGSAAVYNPTAGEYLTLFSSATTSKDASLLARRVSADGRPLEGPVVVLPDAENACSHPSVAHNSRLNEYLVVCSDRRPVGLTMQFYALRLSAEGARIGPVIPVSGRSRKSGDTSHPAVAYNPLDDQYLIAWASDVPDAGENYEPPVVYVRRLNGDGVPLSQQTRVSRIAPSSSQLNEGARDPSIAYNSELNEYLLAWEDERDSSLYLQRLANDGSEVEDDTRLAEAVSFSGRVALAFNSTDNQYLVSWIGPEGPSSTPRHLLTQRLGPGGEALGGQSAIAGSRVRSGAPLEVNAGNQSVIYDSRTNNYLVAWLGSTRRVGFGGVFAQRLSALGEEIGDDTLISTGDESSPISVAYRSNASEFLVAWTTRPGRDVVPNNFVGRGVRFLGTPGTNEQPRPANCVGVLPPATEGLLVPDIPRLRINQRYGQAALRRANAIEAWLNEGLVNADLCGGGLDGDTLGTGVSYSAAPLLRPTPKRSSPRPLVIPPPQSKAGVKIEATARQMRINQRIYSAALRRTNALRARINGQLTGGDIRDGQLTPDRLGQDLLLGPERGPGLPQKASQTKVKAPRASKAKFLPTRRQARINRRIALAALRRADRLAEELAAGLTAKNFATGSIGVQDFTP